VDLAAQKLLLIGKIIAARGLRGELSVFSYTYPSSNLLKYDELILRKNNVQQTFKLQSGFVQGKKVVIKLENVIDRNMAEDLVSSEVYLEQSKLPVLADDELYWYELEGLQVVTSSQQLFGVVASLMATGANDVLVVKPCVGSIDQRTRVLPFIKTCVLSVDLRAKVITVDWDADF